MKADVRSWVFGEFWKSMLGVSRSIPQPNLDKHLRPLINLHKISIRNVRQLLRTQKAKLRKTKVLTSKRFCALFFDLSFGISLYSRASG